MKYKRIKALLLRNNDKILDTDGLMTISKLEFNIPEEIITFDVQREDGSKFHRWAALDSLVNKVTES